MFKANDCATMGDWLRVYNVADVMPFMEALGKWLNNTMLIRSLLLLAI